MQEMQVWPLGWEDPLQEELATHFSILARRIPWTEEPGGPQSIGWQRVRHFVSTHACIHSPCHQESMEVLFSFSIFKIDFIIIIIIINSFLFSLSGWPQSWELCSGSRCRLNSKINSILLARGSWKESLAIRECERSPGEEQFGEGVP